VTAPRLADLEPVTRAIVAAALAAERAARMNEAIASDCAAAGVSTGDGRASGAPPSGPARRRRRAAA
jgi:hypothetical protein